MWMTIGVLGVAFVGLAIVSYRRWRRRRMVARRVVEKPNSHFSSEHVRRREQRSKWSRIDVSRLHPLNRDEVQRLLIVADQAGIGALSPKDRLFLDNMSLPRSSRGRGKRRKPGHHEGDRAPGSGPDVPLGTGPAGSPVRA